VETFDRTEVERYLLDNVPKPLIVAVSIQTTRTSRNTAIADHIANISLKVYQEFEHFYSLNDEMREMWLESVNRAPASVEAEEYMTPVVKPYHPVISPMMLCLEDLSKMTECSICFEDKKQIEIDTTNCGHAFCHKCICKHIDTKMEQTKCPLCRTEIKTIEVNDPENYAAIEHRYSEMGAMLKDILVMEFNDEIRALIEVEPYEHQLEAIVYEFGEVPEFMEILDHHAGNLFRQVKYIWVAVNERELVLQEMGDVF